MNIQGFLNTIGSRLIGSPRTTVGGGIAGMIFAMLIGKLESMSGCHFQEAFAGIDWGELAGYLFGQIFGIIVTDSSKVVATKGSEGVLTTPTS